MEPPLPTLQELEVLRNIHARRHYVFLTDDEAMDYAIKVIEEVDKLYLPRPPKPFRLPRYPRGQHTA